MLLRGVRGPTLVKCFRAPDRRTRPLEYGTYLAPGNDEAPATTRRSVRIQSTVDVDFGAGDRRVPSLEDART